MASKQHESSSDGDSTRWSRFAEFWKTLPGVLTGIATVVGAAAALLTATHPFGGGEDPPATFTASAQPDGCRFRLTAPKNRARVTDRSGMSIAGTACKDDYVWIFDYPSGAERYYRKNHAPLAVIGGEWSYEDEHIGALDDPVGTTYRIVAIRVGRACSRVLEAIHPDEEGRVRLMRLPGGCPDVRSAANARSVVVVKGKS
jgi:hypothetical protein